MMFEEFWRSRRCAAVVAGFLAVASNSWAASTDFERFTPTPVPEQSLMVESPYLQDRVWTVGGVLQLERDPIVAADPSGASPLPEGVFYRTQLHLLGTYKILELLQVSADLPITVLSDQKIAGDVRSNNAYLNDLMLRARAPIWSWRGLQLGASGWLTVNTGSAANFGGTDARFLQPGLLALGEYAWRAWTFRANLGWAERDHTVLPEFGIELGDEFLYRFAAGTGLPWWEPDLTLELIGSSQMANLFQTAQHDARELLAGVQRRFGDWIVGGGLGLGLSKAYGVPSWRLVTHLFYAPTAAVPPPPAPPDTAPPPAPGRGTLIVLVTDTYQLPISSAEISWPFRGTAETARVSPWGVATAEPPVGEVDIQVSAPGYHSKVSHVTIADSVRSERRVVLDPKAFSEVAPPRVDRIERELAKLSFTLLDAGTGAPMAEEVSVYIPELNLEETAENGAWHVLLPPGSYRFAFGVEGYYPAQVSLDVAVGEDQQLRLALTEKREEEKVVVTEQEIYINEKINFASGSANIRSRSEAILNDLVSVLENHPDVRKVLILGHTDSVGSREFNMQLSQRRAEAVRRYMIEEGVAPERLEARGLGPDQPIADNATAEGREVNRRVEFKIVEREGAADADDTGEDLP